MEANDDYIPSPCIRLCRLDGKRGLCVGCLRTLDEITRWGAMTPAERLSVLDAVKRRAA